MAKRPPQDEGPTERQKTPSSPPILQRIGRACRRLLSRAAILGATLWRYIVGTAAWVAAWAWRHRWDFWSGLFRFATLLSVGYLVYDRIYEADATLSISGSDPAFAFEFPFTITNNSHIFTIRNVKWMCEHLKTKAIGVNASDNKLRTGTVSSIKPGQALNFDCSVFGPRSNFIRTPRVKIDEAVIRITLAYDADLFGWYTLARKPEPTTFTWWGTSSNPQWVRGDFAR